jgi:hypothetical protein
MASNEINQLTTHDLWVEARKFNLSITRPTSNTIQLSIRKPVSDGPVDGAVLTLSDHPITATEYPEDGTQYTGGSLVFGQTGVQKIGRAQVISFWSTFFQVPFPSGTISSDGMIEWTVTVTGTNPSATYYASIHACTNILQYYPIGIQSYPLESSRVEKDSSAYTGSIPTLPSAPTSPTPGMVYHDLQLNSVQYWDDTRSVWVPTRSDTITTGPINPGIPGQTYLFSPATTLKVFNGKEWTIASSTNLQLKTSPTQWTNMGSVTSGTKFPETPNVADFFYDFTSQRIQFWDGAAWQIPTTSNTLFNTGSSIVPAFAGNFTVEPIDFVNPYVGLLFYNTSQKILNVWNGTSWQQANTSQQGTPTTDKIRIGNDGSYDERLRLIRVIKSEFGWPNSCIELTEDNFNTAIDNALETYRQLSAGAYEKRYILQTLVTDQQTYYLNNPVDETDRIVTVQKIHRLNILGANSMNWDTNVYFQTFLSQFYSSGYTDILSIHLMHSLSEEFQRIFAGEMTFLWNEARRELMITRRVARNEKVVLEVDLERTEQELLLDRYAKQFIQQYATATVKEMLGLLRSKYSSGTPGPAGTITLNGDTLIAEARQDFAELKEALLNWEYQSAAMGNVSMIFG